MEASLFNFIRTVTETLSQIKVWSEANARKENDHYKEKVFEAFQSATNNIPKNAHDTD